MIVGFEIQSQAEIRIEHTIKLDSLIILMSIFRSVVRDIL